MPTTQGPTGHGRATDISGEGDTGKTYKKTPKLNPDVGEAYSSSAKEANHQKFRYLTSASTVGERFRVGLEQAWRNEETGIQTDEINKRLNLLTRMYDVINAGNSYFYPLKYRRSIKIDQVLTPCEYREFFWWRSMPKALWDVLSSE